MMTVRRLSRHTTTCIVLIHGCLVCTAHAQTLQDLGAFTPAALSADGRILAGSDRTANGTLRAIHWTPDAGVHVLGDSMGATGISADGAVVVGTNPYIGERWSWRWTEESGLVKLQRPETNLEDDEYLVGDVSHDSNRTIIVGSVRVAEPGVVYKAVRWVNGRPEILFDGQAQVISDDGRVIFGWRYIGDNSESEPLRWENGGIQTLSGEVQDISADGTTTVGSILNVHTKPVRWGPSGQEFLSDEIGGATAVSGDGSVVVGIIAPVAPDVNPRGFFWTENDGLRVIKDVVEDQGTPDASGWAFSVPMDISDDGRVIAGYDHVSGGLRGWRLTLCGMPMGWESASGGSFTDSTNWAFQSPPDSVSTARFATGGLYSASFDENVTNNRLEAAEDTDVTLALGGNTYTLTAGCTAPSALIDGAYVDLQDGTVEAVDSVRLTGSEPVLHVDAQATLVVDSDEDGTGCLVADGESGEALVSVAGEGRIESHACSIFGEKAGTSGQLVMDEDGHFVTDTLVVGGEGDGMVEAHRGHVQAEHLYVGEGEESYGSVSVEDVGTLYFEQSATVGLRGAGELNLRNVGLSGGGNIRAGETSLLILGKEDGGTGTLRIEDHGFFSNSDAVVGQDGEGFVSMQSGGTADIRRIWIGGHLTGTTGHGSVILDGAGTTLTARRIWVGRGYRGLLFASNGALVRAGQITVYGSDSFAEADSGGTIRGRVLYVGESTPTAPKLAAAVEGIVTDTLLLVGEGFTLEADTLVLAGGGVIGGSGTFPLPLANTASIAPGDSSGTTGTFRAGADYTQTGVLEIELGGTHEGRYDRLDVAGEAVLGGTLRLVRLPGYIPRVGDAFTILTASAVEGTFEQVEMPNDVALALSYGATEVVATVTAASVRAEEQRGEVPAAYTLEQNYPNPFTREATITYGLPAAGPVTLVVYDVFGRAVRELVRGEQPAGVHDVSVEAGELPSGVYFYRLMAGGRTLSRRMVLMR